MIRILVVEDEPIAREHLARLLEEWPGVEVIGQAENGREALALMPRLKPDALFLDIQMPGLTGTELMHALPEPRPAIVFVTGSADHAVEAFAGGAVHYLLKPVSRLGVAQALGRIGGSSAAQEWLRIPVHRASGTQLLRPEEVEALVADLGDCVVWTSEGRLPVDGSLAYWEERLASHGFMRIHRKALARLDAVKAISHDGELVLATGRIPISRRRLEEIRRALGLT